LLICTEERRPDLIHHVLFVGAATHAATDRVFGYALLPLAQSVLALAHDLS
jgi:hypothetical protein